MNNDVREIVARSCPSGRWDVFAWQPKPGREIQGVRRYRGFRLDLARPSRHLMISDRVSIVTSFEGQVRFSGPGGEIRTADPYEVVIVGPHSRAVVAEHDSRFYGMSVTLYPWTAFGLFGVSMHRLSNSVLRADDVLGTEIPGLTGRYGLAASWPERFARLEEFLVRRAAHGAAYSPLVVRAWQELSRTGGSIPIEQLAANVGWCRRNLARQFREQIGLSPKTLARLLRLRRACQLLAGGTPTGQVAEACGYYDQAHFVHDFKRLTGRTPGGFVAPGNRRRTETSTIERYPAVFAGLIT